jgi:DNA-binding NarL/FixJ family response regulator
MRVLITDAQPVARDALSALVARSLPGVEAVKAGDLCTTLRLLNDDPAVELVFLDPALPDAHDLLALETLRWSHADIPVVVVSDRVEGGFVRAVMEAGARAYVSKRWQLERLRAAVRLVLVGGAFAPVEALVRRAALGLRYIESEVAPQVGEAALRRLRLTRRQRQVLAMLAEGSPNKVICRSLGLAENTVKAHTSAIYRALNVGNRTQALAALVRLGITVEMLLAESPPADGLGELGRAVCG